MDEPWEILGDYNTILSPTEKKGGRPHRSSQSLDLVSCIDDCGLEDAGYSGNKFTWTNGRKKRKRICKRLDWVFHNEG